tara:strand:- start:53 stop:295 length:243 start_codon:yes stop_codon:yes gene_type:complete
MEITKKEIKLIIDTFESYELDLISEWSAGLDSEEKAFLNKLKAAINYTRCCTELVCNKCDNSGWVWSKLYANNIKCECGN